jgi:general nucleoside transport system permease protein
MTTVDRGTAWFLNHLHARSRGWLTLAIMVVAVIAALGLSSLLIAATGGSPIASVRALYDGSMANSTGWTTTLLNTGPLLLVAVGSCISARSGTFNIGQEGQVLIGAFAGAFVALRIEVRGPMLLVLVLLAAAAAGGAWAGLSALMLRFRGVNVAVSTLLMIFIAQQIVAYAVSTDWFLQETASGSGIANPESNQVPSDAQLPTFGQYPHLQLNVGLFIAAGSALVIWMILARTRYGFRLKLVGLNPLAARHAGVRVAAMGGFALAISGAFAGLGGALLLTSPIGTYRLSPAVSDNVGWDGLLVALVARNRPMLAVPVALLFGVLRAGGDFLAATGVPSYVVDVAKALLVLAFVAPPVLVDALRGRRNVTGAPPSMREPIVDKIEVAA